MEVPEPKDLWQRLDNARYKLCVCPNPSNSNSRINGDIANYDKSDNTEPITFGTVLLKSAQYLFKGHKFDFDNS